MGENEENKDVPNQAVDEEAGAGIESSNSSDSVSVIVESVSEIMCTKKEVTLYACGLVTITTVLTSIAYYLGQYYRSND
jgi:hypothetical protein